MENGRLPSKYYNSLAMKIQRLPEYSWLNRLGKTFKKGVWLLVHIKLLE